MAEKGTGTPLEKQKVGPPKIKKVEGKEVVIDACQQAGMVAALGGNDPDMMGQLAAQAIRTMTTTDTATEADYNYVLAAMHAFGPQNPLEGMLAVQAVGCHNLAMKFMGMAAHPNQPDEIMFSCADRAVKMSKSSVALLEALGKLRGQGQQKIVVEHVNVEAGGQAVVGNVQTGKG